MKQPALQRLLVATLVLGLAACASAPKKSAPDAPNRVGTQPESHSGKKKSPYAPAQEDPNKRGDYTAGGLYAPNVADSAPDDIADVEAIPEPEVTAEPRSRYGNRASYSVLGKKYQVLDSAKGYREAGTASYYGKKFHGRRTSNMEVYDMYAFSAAHKTLPLPSFARVTNLDNGKSVTVRVNDRGPFHAGRVIDLSYAAAVKLGITQRGTGRVEVRALDGGKASKPDYASAANNPPPQPAGKPSNSAIDTLVAAMPIASANATEATTQSPRVDDGAVDERAVEERAVEERAVEEHFRFDMRKDGKTMSADEFEAWMQARQVRVATGKPGVPTARVASGATGATVDEASVAAKTAAAEPTTSPAKGIARDEDRITLQVASFAARANADRALAMLKNAGIDAAQLLDASANGQKLWRLRVGPLAAAVAPELSARIVGLGFGPPQRVRE